MSRSTTSVAFASTRTTARRHLLPSSSSRSPFVRKSSSSSSQDADFKPSPLSRDDHDPKPTPPHSSKVPSSYRALVLKQQLEEEKFFSRQTNELAKSLPPPKPNGRPSLPPSSPPSRSQWKLSAYNSYGNLITSSPSTSSSSSSRPSYPRTSLSTPRTPLDLPPRQLPSPSSGQFLRSVTPVYGSRQDERLPSTFDDAEEDYVRDYKLRVQARLIQDLPMSLRPPRPLSPPALDLSPTPPPLDPLESSLDHPKSTSANKEAAIPSRRWNGKAKADFDASRIYEMNENDLYDAAASLVTTWRESMDTGPERLQALCIRCLSLGLPHLAIRLLNNFPLREPGSLFLAPASSLHHHPPWFIRDVLSSHISLLPPSPLSYRVPPSSKSEFVTTNSVKDLADFLSRLGQIDSAIFPGDPVVVALALRAFDAFLRGPMEAPEGKKRKLAEFNFQKIVGLITKSDFRWSMGKTFSLGEHGKQDLEISLAGLPEEVRDLPIWKTVRMVPPRKILQDLIDRHRPPPPPSQPDLLLDDATPSSSSSPPQTSPKPPPSPPSPPVQHLSDRTLSTHLSSLPFNTKDDPILTLQYLELLSLTFPSKRGQLLFDQTLKQARLSNPSRWTLAPAPASSSPTLPPFSPLDSSAPPPSPPPAAWQLALSAHQAMTDPGGPCFDEIKSTLERLSPLFGSRNDVEIWKAYLDANDPERWEARRQKIEEEWTEWRRLREEMDWKSRRGSKKAMDASRKEEREQEQQEEVRPKGSAMDNLRRTLSVGLVVKR